jgi:hypothetical protein
MAQAYAGEIGGSNQLALYRSYAGQAALRPSVWIHTPSVVISRTQGQMANMVGGHNLDSKVVRFRVSETVAKGDARVIDEGTNRIVLVSARDAQRIPELLRTTALAPNKTALTASLKPILLKPVEVASNLPRSEILGFEASNPAARGLSASQAHAPVLGGWSSEAATVTAANPAQTFAKLGTRSITVEKNPDFSFAVYNSDSHTVIKAGSYDAAVDAVVTTMKNPDGPAGAWSMDLRGFDGPDAKNFIRSTEVQFSAKEKLQVAGFATRDGLESKSIVGKLSERYDFRNARIIEAVPEEVAGVNGETLHALNVKVEIPSITAAKPSLMMRIKIYFSERITGPALEAVQRTVQSILLKAQLRGPVLARQGMSKDAVAAHILAGIKDDLSKVSVPGARKVDFEIEVNSDFGDFLVAEKMTYANEYPG